MQTENESGLISNFDFEGHALPVEFVETLQVKDGVECVVYRFAGDISKDLGIIRIQGGAFTPAQKVVKGDRTIEGYLHGKGMFVVVRNRERKVYEVGKKPGQKFLFDVKIGDWMQWQADDDSNLVASEVCFPPFEDGRFINLPDKKL